MSTAKTITCETLGGVATDQDAARAAQLMAERGWNADGTGRYAEYDDENELQSAWEKDLTEIVEALA